MSVNSVNLNTQVNNQPQLPVQNAQQKPKENNKKKYVMTIMAAACVAAAVTGGILIHRKFQPQKLLKEGEAFSKQAMEVMNESGSVSQKAMKAYSEVSALIQEGRQNGFQEVVDNGITRRFTLSEDKIPEILEEFDQAGAILRKTNIRLAKEADISSCFPETIEEFITKSGKSNIYNFDRFNGKYSALFDVTRSKDGAIKGLKKEFCFTYDYNDKKYFLSHFRENCKIKPKDGTSTMEKALTFDKNGLHSAYTSYRGASSTNYIYQNIFEYDKDGKLSDVFHKAATKQDYADHLKINSDGKLEFLKEAKKSFDV